MQRAVAVKSGNLVSYFDYHFDHGQEIEYEYTQGMVRFAGLIDSKGNNKVSMYHFHKAIENGFIERKDE